MNVFYDIESGGFKNGELMVMMGRQSGKSLYYDYFKREQMQRVKFSVDAEAIVDGEQWYTVRIAEGLKDISAWLRSLDKNLAVEHKSPMVWCDSMFDIHEKIYIMLELKYK